MVYCMSELTALRVVQTDGPASFMHTPYSCTHAHTHTPTHTHTHMRTLAATGLVFFATTFFGAGLVAFF